MGEHGVKWESMEKMENINQTNKNTLFIIQNTPFFTQNTLFFKQTTQNTLFVTQATQTPFMADGDS